MQNTTKRKKSVRRNGRGAPTPMMDANGGQTRRPVQNGNARQKYERYIGLARDAAAAGDEIEAENLYQHAEHYLRTMREQA